MRKSWKFVTLSVTAVLATAALIVSGAATAASVTPTEVTGNFTGDGGGNNYGCADYISGKFVFNGTSSPVADGQVIYTGQTPSGSSYSLTVTQTGGNSIDFSITGGLVLVAAVKGSNSFNLYNYQPAGSAGDTGLIPPNFPGQMSHYVFCIGDPGTPSAALFSSASAARTKAGVTVRWTMATNLTTVGFNVYRQVKGHSVRVNKQLIRTHSSRSYSFVDSKAPHAKNLRYRIQAVQMNGQRVWFGPLAIS